MTTPAQLSAQIADLLTRWDAQQDQTADWLTGSPTGGPNGDGRYPLTNAQGETELFLSLPAIVNQVSGPAATATTARNAAQAAAALAQAAQAAADAARNAAINARTEASAIRADITTQQSDVAAKWSDVSLWHSNINSAQANTDFNVSLVEGVYDEVETNLAAAEAAAALAVTARNDAQSFAASINPVNFAAASHTHTITQVTGLQAALDAKLAMASFTWTGLSGKPTTFAPSAHSHIIADVTGLQAALDAKQASLGFTPIQQGGGTEQLGNKLYIGWTGSGLNLQIDGTNFGSSWPISISGAAPWANITGRPSTFAPSAHSHIISDVTGLQTALDARAALSHTHTIAQVTGLQSALDGKISTTNYLTIDGNIQAWDSTLTRGVILTSDGSVEIFRTGGGAYIDLKDSGAEDFDVRLQAGGTVLNITASAVTVGGTAVSLAGHTHTIAQVTGLQAALDLKLDTSAFTWAGLLGKPTTFAPSAHSHAIADVTGLQTALNDKLSTASFTWAGLTGKPTTFAPAAHTHAIDDILNLESRLAAIEAQLSGV